MAPQIHMQKREKNGGGGTNFCRRELRLAGLDGRFGGDGNVYFTFAHGVLSEIRD
jgi:hypothetical protein